MQLLFALFILAVSYLLGSVNSSILIGHLFGVKDIREHGSGNAGATNVLRTIGKKAAALTFLFDVLKGVIAVLLAVLLNLALKEPQQYFLYLAGLFVVVGHIFPVFFKFKGGKGVATSFGVVIIMSILTGCPWLPLALFGIFFILVLLTRYVSLGSVLSVLSYPVFIIFLYTNDLFYIAYALLTAALVIFMHRKNIVRLCKGSESKIGEKKK